jgi:hypothetical protein
MMLLGVEIQAGMGYDLMGKHTNFLSEYDKQYDNVDNGMSPYLQIIRYINTSKLGLGIEYQPLRSLRPGNNYGKSADAYVNRVSYLPVYVTAQLPVNQYGNIFEVIAEFGYAFNLCQSRHYGFTFEDGYDKPAAHFYPSRKLRGGMHAGLGFAIKVNKVAFQMMYKSEHGYFDPTSTSRSYLETSHLSIGARWDMDLAGK